MPLSVWAILISAGLVAGVSLFGHTFPTTPAGTTPVLASTCAGGSLVLQTAVPLSGTGGGIRFDCGPGGASGVAALTVSASGSVTPAYALPAGATGLSLIAHATTNAGCFGGSPLTSGSAIALTAPAALDYCLLFGSYPAGGLASWTLTWSE